MTTRFSDWIAKLPADRRARIDARTKELVAEELALRELRKAVELTQVRMGELLGIGQDGVSRIEKRCDMLVSTLRSYVAAMGGRLRLMAELPDLPLVEVVGLSEVGGIAITSERAGRTRMRVGKIPRRTPALASVRGVRPKVRGKTTGRRTAR